MSDRRGDTFVIEPPGGAISFSTFLLGLASSTLIHLDVTPNPETGSVQVSIELAQQSMDLLVLLRARSSSTWPSSTRATIATAGSK